jgi:NRAMP (natural resistance-associated macrophage protein)-like metal ion transporter
VIGASTGFSLLWLLLLSTPMMFAVQEMGARIGTVTDKQLQRLILERFGRSAAYACALVVVVCNVATISADIAGVGIGLQLVTGVDWRWFILPVGATMGYLLLAQSYQRVSRFLLYLSPLFLLYVASGFLAHPSWVGVLRATLLPGVSPSATYLLAAVGLLGTTISPYLIYWQTAEDVESRTRIRELKQRRVDVAVGMVFSNLIAFFVIVCTAAVLHPHPALRTIQTAQQAARALEPLAGPLAFALFAVGLVVSGLLAVPVLAASTSYVAMATIREAAGLDRSFQEARHFYWVIFAAIALGGIAALAGLSPIQLLFYSQVLDGLLMPFLLVFVIRLADDEKLMGRHTSGVAPLSLTP